MRADRLLSLLMLLQSRGQMTAQELADELEVSERTIYRDITALSDLRRSRLRLTRTRRRGEADRGVSHHADRSHARRDARPLHDEHPRAADAAGHGRKVQGRTAQVIRLPARTHAAQDESRTRQRILLDSSWWFQAEQQVPCLQTIQQALWQDRRLRIKVRWDFFNTEFEQDAEPYGLVAKANIWYLVYGRGGTPKVTRVSQIVEAELMPEGFARPPGFQLEAFWEEWCREYEIPAAVLCTGAGRARGAAHAGRISR